MLITLEPSLQPQGKLLRTFSLVKVFKLFVCVLYLYILMGT